MQEMSAEFIDEFEGIDNQETFFTPAETSLLVYSCIIGITTKAVSSKGGGGGSKWVALQYASVVNYNHWWLQLSSSE